MIHGAKPTNIHAFFETLLTSSQLLETLGKLKEVTGYIRMTIDKLEGICNDLVRTDDDWREWQLPEVIEALRKWTMRNSLKLDDIHLEKHSRSSNFQTRQQESKPMGCVSCNEAGYRSMEFKRFVAVSDRWKILGNFALTAPVSNVKRQIAAAKKDVSTARGDTIHLSVQGNQAIKCKLQKRVSKCW